MATLGIPAVGYGIRYEYGIFRQTIVNGAQVEQPDNWLRYPNPWEIARPERLYLVRFCGRVEVDHEAERRGLHRWVDTRERRRPWRTTRPSPGTETTSSTRCASGRRRRRASSTSPRSTAATTSTPSTTRRASENLARVLYPNDQVAQGRELRLRQEYFFVSATLQDAIRRHRARYPSVKNLHEAAVFQLNDTHPAVAVAELMRLLIDEHGARLGRGVVDHLARLRVHEPHGAPRGPRDSGRSSLFGRVLPRHLQIVYEINRRFLDEVRARFPGDEDRVRRMSLIAEGAEQRVRMAHLAIVGSISVNGVSALHSRILRERLFRDFAELWPKQVRQPDERRDAAALAAQVQPGALRAHHVADRRGLGRPTSRSSRS